MGRQRIEHHATTTADPATVYALLRDGASWPEWSPIDSVELERPGDAEPEGVGAVRVLRSGRVTGRDTIAELVPDRRFAYTHASSLPVRDYRGEIDLTPAATGQLQQGAAQLAKDMELRIAIAFPGPVSQQSGGTITGNTVTWTPAFGEKTEILATGSAIGGGGDGPTMWILLGLAILLVVVVALVVVRSRRSQVPPEAGTEIAATPPAPAPLAATEDPAQPPPAG